MNRELQWEIEQWLYREADLLDRRDWDAWAEGLAEDVEYSIPLRQNVGAERSSDVASMYAVNDNHWMLRLRIDRLRTGLAWAEDPPSRTRHLVSNVRVVEEGVEELGVVSNLLLVRNRDREGTQDIICGQRQDRFRNRDGAWKLVRRVVLLDQADLGTRNLGIFL